MLRNRTNLSLSVRAGLSRSGATPLPAAPPSRQTSTAGLALFGPDFPFPYDEYVRHPAGLGAIPARQHGTSVAVIGAGITGVVTAHELMKLGLKPVLYEAGRMGGRFRSERLAGHDDVVAEMGAMRFPASSRTLSHYVDACGLETSPFPNPLAAATRSTVINLKGETVYARTPEDLPPLYRAVSQAWHAALENHAHLADMQKAIKERDVAAIKGIWNELLPSLDDRSFYGFLAAAPEFAQFSHREVFGQVGFGTGGWDTDFPNSMLEILRVIFTGHDEDHYAIVGGCESLVRRLWELSPAPETMTYWRAGTSIATLNRHRCRPAVTALDRTDDGDIAVTDADGEVATYPAVVFTGQNWLLRSKVRCDERLFPRTVWSAVERTHYMQASKTFVFVERPFWYDHDPATGRDVMSMTLTDRMPRATYLLGGAPDRPATICLSYTWTDDSLKWLPLTPDERVDIALDALRAIYPRLDVRRHVIGAPVTISWESEPWFMGAFKANLPGHYRYQRRLFTHFMQRDLGAPCRGLYLAGDDISWTGGWAEGAIQTALNAVWGVMEQLGGRSDLDNPGPGDRFSELAPLLLPED